MNHTLSRIAFLALVLLQASCGPRTRDVLAGYKDRFDAKRKQFAEVAAELPPPGKVVKNACTAALDPKPLYDARSKTFNTEIVMESQLRDPDVNATELDLRLSDNLLRGMQWTGPKSPMGEDAMASRAPESLKTEMSNALGYPYLVVNRPARFIAPKAINDETFTPGSAEVEGFLFDLRSSQIVCSFHFAAKTDDAVRYQYKQEKNRDGSATDVDNKRERLESFAYSTLWSSSRENVARILTEITQGTFTLD